MAIDYINTLGAGAGFNTKEVVSALVEAERAPVQSRIEGKVTQKEAEISALGIAVENLETIKSAAEALNDRSDFNTFAVSNSQPTALSVESDSNASIGTHSITVSTVAREQRTNLSAHGGSDFSSKTQTLNSGTAFDLSIVVGDSSTVTHTVSVSTATPQGIVDAVNSAGIDVTAQLIDKGTGGTNYIVQLVGKSGSDNQFSVTPSANSVLASNTPSGFAAANASLTVNGVSYSRSSNSINDIIEGVTLGLNSATSGAANITVNQETESIESNIKTLVQAFNNAKAAISELTNREVEGALAGDSVFRQSFRSVKNLFLNASSTPGSSLKTLSDLGISVNKTGQLEVSETKLNSALASNFSEIRTLFSADTESQTAIGEANRGIAGDLSKLIQDLNGSNGYLTTRATLLNQDIEEQELALTELDSKMDNLKERYERQFARMNAIIDEMNNTKENLISSFENLPFTNRD